MKKAFLCFGAKNAQNQVFRRYNPFGRSVRIYAKKKLLFFFGAKYRQNQVFEELGLIQQHFFPRKNVFHRLSEVCRTWTVLCWNTSKSVNLCSKFRYLNPFSCLQNWRFSLKFCGSNATFCPPFFDGCHIHLHF